jgi:hypothetical protein
MELSVQRRRAASRGLSKFSIAVILIVIVGGIYLLSKFGPVYQDKWKLEDRMEDDLRRTASLGQEGIFGDLAAFTEKNGIPAPPADPLIPSDGTCKFIGEPGKPGNISCHYTVLIEFPLLKNPYPYEVVASKHLTYIPLTSN